MITKISKLFCGVLVGCAVCAPLASCSDMLEAESTRQNIEPSIDQKTDSVFYAYGILQAMQQLADQYVFQGEMRGDLVKTTFYTDNNLRQLANFSATTANKYDSVYVYYRVINNCNYYIAHCDTNQYNGSTNVVIDKYIAAKAIRAWAYLQLGRNYQRVPFFTEPLTQISQIDDNRFPELDLAGITAQLAPDLEQYTGSLVPTLGFPTTAINIGSPSWESSTKNFLIRRCFIPIDVVLGDLYLETANYEAAARHYVTYFTKVAAKETADFQAGFWASLMSKNANSGRFGAGGDDDLPDQTQMVQNLSGAASWSGIFARNSVADIVSYIPMATSAQNGPTTQVPLIFGYDYYTTPEEKQRSGAPYVDEIQLLPSDVLNTLSDSTEYYYFARYAMQTNMYDSVRIAKCGDMRLRNIIHTEQSGDTAIQWIDKYKYANIILYRHSTIWLRLAEAFNRLGMTDAAFAILKDGISEALLTKKEDGTLEVPYMTDESAQKLQSTYPLLSSENIERFASTKGYGIHTHGAGAAVSDFPHGSASQIGGQAYHPGQSPYKFDAVVGKKLKEIAEAHGVAVGTTKQDTINAIEDLICDELALETAFEGNRWYDLKRMATHKNESGLYGGNFGGQWLARKLAFKSPVVNLEDQNNWYLPFK